MFDIFEMFFKYIVNFVRNFLKYFFQNLTLLTIPDYYALFSNFKALWNMYDPGYAIFSLLTFV